MEIFARSRVGEQIVKPSRHKTTISSDPLLIKDLTQTIEDSEKELVELTSHLVSMNSLLGNEHDAQNFMEDQFKNLSLETDRFGVDHQELSKLAGYSPSVGNWENHENIVGTYYPKKTKGHSLIMNGHIDVVPVGDERLWTTSPFTPSVREGQIFGRGSGDMKAGIAAFIVAFSSFKKIGIEPAGKIFLQSVVEEECTGNGALACLHRGYKAEAAVIPEPFNETVMSAQVGVLWVNLEVFGKPSHVLNTNLGTNAIEGAFALWQGLKILQDDWNSDRNRPDAFSACDDPIKFNLGIIEGGEWASSLATRCQMNLRLGFFPGTKVKDVCIALEKNLNETIQQSTKLSDITFNLHYSGFQSEGYVADMNSEFIKTLSNSHKIITGDEPDFFASAATTDAKMFELYGNIPATCYGPNAKNIHGIDESVSIDSIVRVTQVLAVFIAKWCGINRLS